MNNLIFQVPTDTPFSIIIFHGSVQPVKCKKGRKKHIIFRGERNFRVFFFLRQNYAGINSVNYLCPDFILACWFHSLAE